MDPYAVGPCAPTMQWFHLIIVGMTSTTTVLTTWLTMRAKRKDREENGARRERTDEP